MMEYEFLPNGDYKASIIYQGEKYTAIFTEKETAELWCKWKKSLLQKKEYFTVNNSELVTLEEAADLKLKSLKEASKRSFDDIKLVKVFFKDLIHKPLGQIIFEDVLKCTEEMIGSIVQRGGRKDNLDTGIKQIVSPATIKRRLASLSSVFGFMQSKGIKVDNPALSVIKHLRAEGYLKEDAYRGKKNKLIDDEEE